MGLRAAVRQGHRRLGADPVLWRVTIGTVVAVAFAYLWAGASRSAWSCRVPRRRVLRAQLHLRLRVVPGDSIVNATLIPALQPVLILLLATRLFGERRTGVELAYAGLALAGVVVVVAGASSDGSTLEGNIFAVAQPARVHRLLPVGQARPDADVHVWSFLAAVFMGACVIVVPWSLLTSHDLDAIHGTDWLLMAGLILLPGMVGHGLMTWAHHYVDVTVTSMMTLANPVVSIAGAWILYDQDLAPAQMVGGVVVLVALGAILRRQRSERALAAEAALTGDLLDE